MPCKKKSISPLYFQIYTIYLQITFFLLCMCADDRGRLCDIFLIPQTEKTKQNKTSARDWSIYGKLFRENPLHCSCRTRSGQVKCDPAIPLVLNVRKENCVTEVQPVAEGANDVLWEQCAGFPSHFTLEIPPGSGSYLSLCDIKKRNTEPRKSKFENMIKRGYGRQDAWLKVFEGLLITGIHVSS